MEKGNLTTRKEQGEQQGGGKWGTTEYAESRNGND